ncbi:MAG TPA: C39 family peptidase [Anaerolineaceae bacterium]|nr:C39 family peptidase [Anaerolineaceae bacterium]
MATKKIRKLAFWRRPWFYLTLLGTLALGAFAIYQIPGMPERLNYHYNQARAKVFYFFRRPQEQIFLPGQSGTQVPTLESDQTPAISMLPTPTPPASNLPGTEVPPTLYPAPEIALPTLMPVPDVCQISDIEPEKQGMNNCGPTTLGIYLRYWGIDTDQTKIAGSIHQVADDRNVGLEEMRDYVLAQTELKAIVRFGGDYDLFRRLVSQGFPVMLERGFYTVSTNEWMGHFGLVTGYDQEAGTIHVPDTYLGHTDFKEADLERLWMQFAYAYLLVYPPEKEAVVQEILGDQWDEAVNARHTLELMREKAKADYAESQAEDQFFAKFGIGVAFLLTGDSTQAAVAFDDAFTAYAQLPAYKRPFRVMWYQFGPYEAYYATSRYQDCVSLAQNTIANSAASGLEESWYWRGKCTESLGDVSSAAYFYQKALDWHPGWKPAQEALQALEEKP